MRPSKLATPWPSIGGPSTKQIVQICSTVSDYKICICKVLSSRAIDIAYRTCRLLGYHNPRSGGPDDDPFYLELKRRAFWCSWSMCCLSQNNASFKAESWREAVGLPLPCDEASFQARQPVVMEAYDSEGHLECLDDHQPEGGRPSYLAEMVKLLSMWYCQPLNSR